MRKLVNGNLITQDQAIEQNIGLVHSVCNKLVHFAIKRGQEYDDIFSVGCVGLSKAYEKWDESRETRFSTYAIPYIRGYVMNHVLNNMPGVYYPYHIRDVANRILARRIEDEEPETIAETLGVSVKNAKYALESIKNMYMMSTDEQITDDEYSETYLNFFGASDDYTTIYVKEFLITLNPKEQYVLLSLMAGKLQKEIDKELNASHSYTYTVRKKIAKKYNEWVMG